MRFFIFTDMEIEELYSLYKKSFKVDTDTRKIRKGAIFFALKGENFNGNQFANEALSKGATFCVIDEVYYEIPGKTILVDNVLQTLQELAKYHRKQLTIPIIGLTGSNGKTTSKELMQAVLSKKYHTIATKGNLNNHIGVPLTILSIAPSYEIGIIEMGANHQKEIEFLSSISLPDFGYITNFGKAHIEGFGGVEGVIKGKSELYQNIRQHKKSVFVNAEDSKQMELTVDLDRYFFYPSELSVVSENPFLTLSYKDIEFSTHLIGNYNVMNIAAAIVIGKHFGVSITNCIDAISNYKPNNNRSQLIEKENNIIHLDAYNANPSSVSEALKSFSKLKDPNKVVILGDMFELGTESQIEHQSMNDLAAHLSFESVFLVGKHYSSIDSNYQQFVTYEEFESYLKNNPLLNSTILIKGSRGMALERILDSIS